MNRQIGSSTSCVFVVIVAISAAVISGFMRAEDASLLRERRLEAIGIPPTVAGINEYLGAITRPDFEENADRLIADLSDDEFAIRQRAVALLAAMQDPPIEKLRTAAASSDREQAERAKLVLAQLKPKNSPLLAACQLIEIKRLEIDVSLLLKLRGRVKSGPLRGAVARALAAAATEKDHQFAKNLSHDSDDELREVGRAILTRLEERRQAELLSRSQEAIRIPRQLNCGGGGPNVVFGWEFQTKVELSVTYLGIYDVDGDGLAASHEIAIWDIERPKEPIVSATVPAGGEAILAGVYRIVPIGPAILPADRRFAIVAHYSNADDGSPTLINVRGTKIDFAEELQPIGRRYASQKKRLTFPDRQIVDPKYIKLGPTFRFEIRGG